MENFKSFIYFIVFVLIISFVGYWAFFTLEPGSVHVEKQKQEELRIENEILKAENESLKSEIRLLTKQEEETKVATEEPTGTETQNPEKPAVSTNKNQTLINELEKLISDGVIMKEKSRGTRVGTVQKFLNLYNKTSNKIDNEFGPGMKTAVLNFQKAQGITADGEAGAGTFRKMIDWLKK